MDFQGPIIIIPRNLVTALWCSNSSVFLNHTKFMKDRFITHLMALKSLLCLTSIVTGQWSARERCGDVDEQKSKPNR